MGILLGMAWFWMDDGITRRCIEYIEKHILIQCLNEDNDDFSKQSQVVLRLHSQASPISLL